MKFSELQKLTAETLDQMEKLGWIVYWNKETKDVFRITDLGKKAFESMKNERS